MNKGRAVLLVVAVALVGAGIYFSKSKNTMPVENSGKATTTTPVKSDNNSILYKNTEYGFSFTLPKSWQDYTVIEDEWEGFEIGANGQQFTKEHGPLVSIRHPDWEYKAPRQDVPVMVFTIAQWNSMQKDEFHIGAAPVNPSELGRNSKYVFALPARYNFSYLVGYEEVDKIVTTKGNFKAF